MVECELPICGAADAKVHHGVVGLGHAVHRVGQQRKALEKEMLDHTVLAAETRVDVHRAHARAGGNPAHGEGGRTFIYLVSDDNFSPLQRTLLLKFELLQCGSQSVCGRVPGRLL